MPLSLLLDAGPTLLGLRVNKGEDFFLTIPVYDANNVLVSLVGWSAVAQLRPVAGGAALYVWSAAAANLTTTAAGVVLQFKAVETILWTTFTRAVFECDVTSPTGTRGIVGRGDFIAMDRVVNP